MDEKPGFKLDGEKLKWNLVIWEYFESVVRVLMFGCKKYAPFNWQKVPNRRERYKDALIRHAVAYCKGELIDPETGESHLSCIGCNTSFLYWMDMTGDKGE